MVALITFSDIYIIYEYNDEVYLNTTKKERKTIDNLLTNVIESFSYEKGYKIACDEDSIKLAYKVSGMFDFPVTIAMGKYQYSSCSDFWRSYVRAV